MMDKIYQVSINDLKNKAETALKSTKSYFLKLKKMKNISKLDKMFHQLHHEIFNIEDCLCCANCCKTIGPILYNPDIERMAKALKMSLSDFIKNYVKTDEDGDMVFITMPCPFLDDQNYCIIYNNRPKACREYPHTDRKRMYQILDLTIKNTFICPAVYRIVEVLKNRNCN